MLLTTAKRNPSQSQDTCKERVSTGLGDCGQCQAVDQHVVAGGTIHSRVGSRSRAALAPGTFRWRKCIETNRQNILETGTADNILKGATLSIVRGGGPFPTIEIRLNA